MPDALDDARKNELARRHVAALTGFYVHAAVFAIVIAGLIAIDAASGKGWWVQWVAGGWGIGVAAHALAVYGQAPRSLRAWQDRKAAEIKSRL